MLHKDMKSIDTKASAFWSAKIIAFAAVMLIVIMALPAMAHSPARVNLDYDSQNQTLNVTTTHMVSNPSGHYVMKIVVEKNGTEVLTREYKSQPASPTFSHDYHINATRGDVLKATTYCSITGSRTGEITVVDAEPIMVQAAAENATVGNSTEGNASPPLAN